MFQIDNMSRIPVYEQLIKQVENYIMTGILKADDRMPSVRTLSTSLLINPNTIQKAYTSLDARGVIYTVPGKGSFVSADAKRIIGESSRKNIDTFVNLLQELRLAGVSKEEIMDIVERSYKK